MLGSRVYRWGPFRVSPGLFERARAQAARLRSGSVLYKVIDGDFRPDEATNCIHAVADIDADAGLLYTGVDYGTAAASLITYHFRRWMIDPHQTHEWVWNRLGLCGLPIEPRSWGRSPGGR